MRCHKIDYAIHGNDLQFVEIALDHGETVIAEAGAMMYIEDGIQFEAKMGDGSKAESGILGKFAGAGKRMISGESLFMTHFTNTLSKKSHVAFSSPYPGKVISIDMSKYNTLTCQKDAFLCAALGTHISIAFTKKFGAGIFGGEGFILQKLQGDGMTFMHSGGTIVQKQLKGETLKVDTGCLVAFSEGIDYSIQRAGNLKSMFFGGEGFFLASLRGHGDVWLQSLPFSRLADRIIDIPSRKGSSTIGNLLSR